MLFSSNMCPALSSKDAANLNLGYTVFFSKFSLQKSLRISNRNYVCLGKLGLVDAFTASLSVLRCHVCNVFGWRSKKQVGRIQTGGIVASVTDIHPIWDLATVQLIRNAVYVLHPSFDLYEAVAPFLFGRFPIPAACILVNFNFREKPLAKVNRHVETS